MFSGGSSWTTGSPAVTHSPSRYRVSKTNPDRGDANLFLLQAPCRVGHRRAVRRHLVHLRANLLFARRQCIHREVRVQLTHPGRACIRRRLRVDQIRLRNSTRVKLCLVAGENRCRLFLRNLGLH